MIQINKSDRKKLEELGILKSVRGIYQHMTVCSRSKHSNGKSIYVEDWMVIFLNPDKYREAMKGYMSKWKIENTIKEVLRGRTQY